MLLASRRLLNSGRRSLSSSSTASGGTSTGAGGGGGGGGAGAGSGAGSGAGAGGGGDGAGGGGDGAGAGGAGGRKHRSHELTGVPGSADTDRSGARAFLRGAGFTDACFAKPIITVACPWSTALPCNIHFQVHAHSSPRFSLLATRYSLLATRYSLLATQLTGGVFPCVCLLTTAPPLLVSTLSLLYLLVVTVCPATSIHLPPRTWAPRWCAHLKSAAPRPSSSARPWWRTARCRASPACASRCPRVT